MRIKPLALCKVVITAFAVLTVPFPADAQQTGKARVIGWLGIAAPAPETERLLDNWRRGLREFGWIESQNLRVEYRWAHGRAERLQDLASDLVAQKAEIVVLNCGPQIEAVRRASATVPIVVAACPDLVRGATLTRPRRNITGLIFQSADMSAKRVQLLKELKPTLSRLAVLAAVAQGYVHPPAGMAEMRRAGRMLGIDVLDLFQSRMPDDIEDSLVSIARQADALMLVADPLSYMHRQRILDAAMKHRLPVMYEAKQYVESGGLLSYGASISALYHRSAYYVDRILRGAKPADLPVEQPTKFELVINLKTAKALGLTIPQSLLLRADQVIQ